MNIDKEVKRARELIRELAFVTNKFSETSGNLPECCPQHLEESLTARLKAAELIKDFGMAAQTAVSILTNAARSDAGCGKYLQELLTARQLVDDLREKFLRAQTQLEARKRAYLQGLD